MVATTLVIYLEGDASLRPGMSQLLDPLRQALRTSQVRLRIETGGDKARTEKLFEQSASGLKLLLIDSDGPPRVPAKDREHEMVEVMETWFLADWTALTKHFNSRADDKTKNRNLEAISKKEVFAILEDLALARRKKYGKTSDAPKLLALLDLGKLRGRAASCDKFCKAILAEA